MTEHEGLPTCGGIVLSPCRYVGKAIQFHLSEGIHRFEIDSVAALQALTLENAKIIVELLKASKDLISMPFQEQYWSEGLI